MRQPADALERATVRRVGRRLVPFLLLLFVACYLDRVNVGFAALQMNRALGLSAAAYGLGAGVFFLGYCVLEIPSNLALARVGARRWIARIMISWGVISAATMLARGVGSFYLLRFLLGAAEAGFFPGVIYYLGEWFPARARARVIARFMVALPIAGIVSGPLSGALLGLQGRLGLAGWQWVFLVEGIPSILLGFVALAFLTDRPEDAAWLPEPERAWLVARLRGERERCLQRHAHGVRRALASGIVWRLGLLQGLSLTSGLYALGFWLPAIVKASSGASDLRVGVLSAVPYLTAAVGMVLIGAHSDRSGDRCAHIALCSLATALGFAASAFLHAPALALAALGLAAVGTFGAMGPFFALPAGFLTGDGAAAGIALINSLANVTGFAVPYGVGLLRDATGGYAAGLAALAFLPLAGAALALGLSRAPQLAPAAYPVVAPGAAA